MSSNPDLLFALRAILEEETPPSPSTIPAEASNNASIPPSPLHGCIQGWKMLTCTQCAGHPPRGNRWCEGCMNKGVVKMRCRQCLEANVTAMRKLIAEEKAEAQAKEGAAKEGAAKKKVKEEGQEKTEGKEKHFCIHKEIMAENDRLAKENEMRKGKGMGPADESVLRGLEKKLRAEEQEKESLREKKQILTTSEKKILEEKMKKERRYVHKYIVAGSSRDAEEREMEDFQEETDEEIKEEETDEEKV